MFNRTDSLYCYEKKPSLSVLWFFPSCVPANHIRKKLVWCIPQRGPGAVSLIIDWPVRLLCYFCLITARPSFVQCTLLMIAGILAEPFVDHKQDLWANRWIQAIEMRHSSSSLRTDHKVDLLWWIGIRVNQLACNLAFSLLVVITHFD